MCRRRLLPIHQRTIDVVPAGTANSERTIYYTYIRRGPI